MGSVLARIRSLPRNVLIAIPVAAIAVFAVVVAVLGSPGDLLGVIALAIYITAILGLSSAVTYVVIKVSPVQKKPKSAEPG